MTFVAGPSMEFPKKTRFRPRQDTLACHTPANETSDIVPHSLPHPAMHNWLPVNRKQS